MQHTYIRTYMRTCVRYVAFKIEVGRAGGSGGRGGQGVILVMCSQLWSPVFSVPLSCRNRVGVRVSGYNLPAFESSDTKQATEWYVS